MPESPETDPREAQQGVESGDAENTEASTASSNESPIAATLEAAATIATATVSASADVLSEAAHVIGEGIATAVAESPPVVAEAVAATVDAHASCVEAHRVVDAANRERVIDATTRSIDDLELGTWLAFTMGACLTRVFCQYPFLVAMTRRQASTELVERQPSSTKILGDMRKAFGVRSWYRGFGAYAGGMVVAEVAYMWSYEALRSKTSSPLLPFTGTTNPDDVSQAALDATAGFSADICTTVAQVPFFLVANRQMSAGVGAASGVAYENAAQTLRRVAAGPSGWRGMFAGMAPSLLLSTHSAFWWSAYNATKVAFYDAARPSLEAAQKAYPWAPAPLVSPTDNIVLNTTASVLTGSVVAVVWNPLYLIRTRMQVAGDGGVPPTMRGVARTILKQEGWRGFGKGIGMSLTSAAVDSTAFSVLYELGKQLAQRKLPAPAGELATA